MDQIHQFAREKLKIHSDKMKQRLDTTSTETAFKPGDAVWLYAPKRTKGKSPKLQSNWEGPYTIIRKINDLVYRIQLSPKKQGEGGPSGKACEDNITKEAPKHCKPSREWQINTIDDFTVFREYVHSQISTEPSLSNFDEDNFIEYAKKQAPLFSIITQYSQSSKAQMLQIITKYVDLLKPNESIEDNLGTWVYAILALLEIPLSPNCCYLLREFARKCNIIRSQLPDNAKESLYMPLNLFICIIAIYFNQLDLVD
ncbi:hypothetical protein NQ318_008103 [Aromia moschata]|uniref:Tf2-1-like SH3-like domain-containing protein n=1 Tax=Aromia moschata TaxID=1265417 RepID=A0AAV8YPT9_9CUCU|nr:hypothetical protein NQ318_008103 [Aromia moschata]